MRTQVLVVDDDLATGEMLTEVLDDAGYAVTLATSGAEALALLEQQSFSVVVSDIRMHPIDGVAVLQATREQDHPPEVILLTGYGALDTSIEAIRASAFDYLLKPCDPDKLLERVAEAVETHSKTQRQHQAVRHVVREFGHLVDTAADTPSPPVSQEPTVSNQEDVLHLGALRIGTKHHDVTFAGHYLHLTPTEHALLRRMAETPGKVFQYRELVYIVHGYDVTNVEATVLLKTHIRNIRHKIGADYLVNVRSSGYRLQEPEQSYEQPPTEKPR